MRPWIHRSLLQWCHNEHDGVSFTSLTIVHSTVYSGTDQGKKIKAPRHWWLMNSPHKGPVTLKMFPFLNVIMWQVVVLQDCIYNNKCTILFCPGVREHHPQRIFLSKSAIHEKCTDIMILMPYISSPQHCVQSLIALLSVNVKNFVIFWISLFLYVKKHVLQEIFGNLEMLCETTLCIRFGDQPVSVPALQCMRPWHDMAQCWGVQWLGQAALYYTSGHFIFLIGILIPLRQHLYIETCPR